MLFMHGFNTVIRPSIVIIGWDPESLHRCVCDHPFWRELSQPYLSPPVQRTMTNPALLLLTLDHLCPEERQQSLQAGLLLHSQLRTVIYLSRSVPFFYTLLGFLLFIYFFLVTSTLIWLSVLVFILLSTLALLLSFPLHFLYFHHTIFFYMWYVCVTLTW